MASQKELSIGNVAQQIGLSVHTLRFYEQERLLISAPVTRDAGGHRRYTPVDVEWLEKCVKLRAAGMPLAKIREYAELVRQGTGNELKRLELLREQQRRIEKQLRDLNDCLQFIQRKVNTYQQRLAGGTPQY